MIYVTLHELKSIIKSKSFMEVTYQGFTFHHICFVARLKIEEENFVFDDGTGSITYDPLRLTNIDKAESGLYYKCLGSLKSMGSSFNIYINNFQQV